MLAQGKSPDTFDSIEDAKQYYKQLWQADKFTENHSNLKKSGDKPSKKNNKRKRAKADATNKDKKCEHCGKQGHNSDDCWTLDKNKNKRPKRFKTEKSEKKYSKEETAHMFTMMWKAAKKLDAKETKKTKRKVTYEDTAGDNLDTNLMAKLNLGGDYRTQDGSNSSNEDAKSNSSISSHSTDNS